MRVSRLFLLAPMVLLCGAGRGAEAGAPARAPDVGFVATPQPMVDAMLKLAAVQRGEIVYDLGCGDGRAVITAAKDFGARGIGVDIDPELVVLSRANAAAAGVADRVRFEVGDLFKMSFADADVIFLYLLPELNLRLRPRLLDELRPGTRVLSHAFNMGEWKPDRVSQVDDIPILLWHVPAKLGGEWTVKLPGGEEGTLSLRQEFQLVTGTLAAGGRSVALSEGRVTGTALTFRYPAGWRSPRVSARLVDGKLTGTIARGWPAKPEPWSAERR